MRLRRKAEPFESLIDHPADTSAGLGQAPIVAVAIDLATMSPELSESVRQTVMRIVERSKEIRVACLNVLKLKRIALDSTLDEDGNNKHVSRIVQLKDWARPLEVPQAQVSFHVLEATDPAEAILEYARENTVDHIVMGARDNSTMRKLLGSVSARVASEAPCTVTVVRDRKDQDSFGS